MACDCKHLGKQTAVRPAHDVDTLGVNDAGRRDVVDQPIGVGDVRVERGDIEVTKQRVVLRTVTRIGGGLVKVATLY